MLKDSSSKQARAPNTSELREQMPSGRTPGKTSARDPAAAPFDADDEAAGRPAPRQAIEQALAHENALAQRNVRLARSPGAVGPIGRAVLLITLLALVGLLAVWVLLAY